uniref:Aldose 1-epimerase n=1 Tax=Salix viminalis TaxID=40686 RepID=A0A6N2L874_SALVM
MNNFDWHMLCRLRSCDMIHHEELIMAAEISYSMARFAALFWFSILVVLQYASIDSAMAEEIGMYELKKGNLSMKLTNYGARIVSLVLPDKNGKRGDVALGFDTIQGFMNASSPFGATVGRVANRISKAQFTLNGTVYKLPANSGNNTIHGFPGDILVKTSYTLLGDNQVCITMKAEALNKATPVNLVNHAFWNLGGHNSGDILSEKIQIFASHYTPTDSKLIPTGEIVTVKGTPYDFLTARTVGSRINELPKGYDINYALDGSGSSKLKKAAVVHDEKSGRVMEILTDQPGVQFFTSNTLNVKGKGGFMYKPHGGLCVVTEGFPDSVNHPNFPSQIVNPGKPYKHIMLFKFSTL